MRAAILPGLIGTVPDLPKIEAIDFAARLDPGFLAEAGWDPMNLALRLPADHRLFGRRVCLAPDCQHTARTPTQICAGCAWRLTQYGLTAADIARIPPKTRVIQQRCQVRNCPRQWISSSHELCQGHRDRQRRWGLTVAQFLSDPRTQPLPACGRCEVNACDRDKKSGSNAYCATHYQRFLDARAADPAIDEAGWRSRTPAKAEPGIVHLRGLATLVIDQVLFALQERTRLNCRTNEDQLQRVCNMLLAQRLTTLFDARVGPPGRFFGAFLKGFAGQAGQLLLDPDTEKVKDVWNLAAFGQSGVLDFTTISQPWLRAAAKVWMLNDLPQRRGKHIGGHARQRLRTIEWISQSLRMRSDGGHDPAELGRSDIENLVHRLAFQESNGQLSRDSRIKRCFEMKVFMSRVRTMGLTRPGGPAAGLGQDFGFIRSDTPPRPDRGEPGRDVPPEVMRQLCAQLDGLEDITSREGRVAIELCIDTGRRPEEISALGWDCLRRDDGNPVLIYDNFKADRLGRRLPIAEATATLITVQQQRVRAAFSHTPIAELKLLPARQRNPDGKLSVGANSVSMRHRQWINSLPPLLTVDGTEFDKSVIVPYSYRHTYAQRHADAGVPPDVLRELMDHLRLEVTQRYYRVGEQRRREAVDRVTALQFDRHGNRTWQQAKALLDSEYVRRAVGEVVVPFGVCAEPSNVKAGGHACPYRFRCVGCDHFRTDVSYLPELQAHLDDLLRNRERILAATDVDDWARAEAMPSTEEITRIRRLIHRITTELDTLTSDDRHQIEQAVATVRRTRTVTLGIPRLRQPLPDVRPEEGTA